MSINICPMVALAAELTNVPLWLCIPFACLLLCIAIIPLVKGEWWEKYRPFAVIFWSLLFIIPFAVKYGAGTAAETVLECLVNDYLTFIVLLFGLFCVAGNITVEGSLVGIIHFSKKRVKFRKKKVKRYKKKNQLYLLQKK